MVKLITVTGELREERKSDDKIAFVPTMGNLHQGHISLLERALSEYKTVYFSIFVNPKQFGPNEDFGRYPRTLENDLKLIEQAAQRFPNSRVVVYSPKDPQEVFPENDNQTISVQGLSTDLEGKIRPGHFDGVATVVYRLFELMKPETAYFGLKDYQQYLVIRQMVKDLALPVRIQGMPIIREAQGLAMSSRNQYLTSEQKEASLLISKTLKEVEKKIKVNLNEAHALIAEKLKDSNWDYLEIRDSETFSPDISQSKNITVLAVYRMGTTRLLDNIQVGIACIPDGHHKAS
jgi:pantoate--beta-alanine ligase